MTHRLLRCISAGLALLALTLGVPLLLVAFGRSPLDGTGSTWEQITELPTQAISDNVAFGLLTMAAWAAWALFAAHVAVELTAALTGGPARWRLHAMGPFQMTARRLVVALTMSATLTSSLSQRTATVPLLATAASAAPATHPVAEVRIDPQAAPAVDPVADMAPGGAPVDPAPPPSTTAANTGTGSTSHVTVAPGDSPWLLAERHLGEGVRWREIWDLNRGQPQPDGAAWIVEDIIRPGWHLQLPADATNIPAPTPPPTPPGPVLPPPDDEEAAAFPPADPVPGTPTTSQDEAPPPAPRPTAPTSSTPVTLQATTTSTVAAADEPATTHDDPDDADQDETSRPAVPLLGIAGSLLAVAALRELHRRQARRRTQLPTAVTPPVGPRLQLHREILLRADDHKADRLDTALAHLARSLGAANRNDPAQPRVVQIAEHRIDVLLDRPDPAPPRPWRPEASGLIWVLDGDTEIPPHDGSDIAPIPALVTIGRGDADILIDLEAYGVVALTGDDDACRGLARSMATALSTRTDDNVAVDIIGDVLDHSVERLDAVRHHDGWDDIDIRTIETSARLLDTGGWPHTWAARTSGRIYDGWTPTIWITTASDHPRYLEALDTINRRPGAGTALVVVGTDPGCGLRIHLDSHGGFEIPDLNLYGATQRLGPDTTDQLADLLQSADTPPDPETANTVPGNGHHGPGIRTSTAALPELPAPLDWLEAPDYQDPHYDVLVRVCGPIRIDGGTTDLAQRETAVAAYIALNGEVDIEQIRDAVWAGADISLKRVRNVISTVRRSVGDAIAFTNDHRLTPGPNLITDLELIRRRLTHAQRPQDPLRKAEILKGALEWVTGRVCTYPHSRRRCWTWIDLDNWIPHVESIVASVASQLARTSLDLDDGEGACRAARRGIETTGQRDELTILLVRGYELLGDEPSARQVIRGYERYLEELGVDELNDDLLELLDRYATPARHKSST